MKNQKTETKAQETAAEQNVLIGEVDQAQINMWKARHRRVYSIVVTDGDELHIGYFHRPDMEILAATNKLRKDDEVKAVGVLFDNCYLGGSDAMKTDAIVKIGAMTKFNMAIAVLQTEIKNL